MWLKQGKRVAVYQMRDDQYWRFLRISDKPWIGWCLYVRYPGAWQRHGYVYYDNGVIADARWAELLANPDAFLAEVIL